MIQVLTIGGIDPCCYSGIITDYKVFSSLGVSASLITTAVTAQNRYSFRELKNVTRELLLQQLNAVFDERSFGAVKTGLIPSEESVDTIANFLSLKNLPLIVDPVLSSTSGMDFSTHELIKSYSLHLIPMAYCLTPNIKEAEILTGSPISTVVEMENAARILADLGCEHVLVKGGHLKQDPVDVLWDGTEFKHLNSERIPGTQWRGLGCTLSAAITVFIAQGDDVFTSVKKAKKYVNKAMKRALKEKSAPMLVHPSNIHSDH